LRSRFPELRDGKLDRVEVSYDEQARWLVMTRAPISVALNLDQSSRTVPLEGLGSRRLLMASDELIVLTTEAVNLPPDSVAIIGPA
jgi:hypothetical protein